MALSLLQALLDDLPLQCAPLQGSVIATAEGLVLAASGVLATDSAAATAAYVMGLAEQHLGLLQPLQCREQLIWADNALWCIQRLAQGHVLMSVAQADCAPGLLRLVCQCVDAGLREHLAQLQREAAALAPAATSP